MSTLRAWTLLAAAAVACPSGSSTTEAPPPTPPTTPPLPATSDGATAPAPAAASSSIDEAAVRELLDRWLGAQNEGSFDAYQALYATRFFGIKRAGDRATSYDRAGWLRDRERMFRRAMRVEAREVSIAVSGESAVVTFVQSWSSGRFSDEGPKQLVVVREGDALRIAREEMIASTLRDPAAGSEPFDAERFLLALDYPEGTYVVLRQGAEAGWQSGPSRLVSRTAVDMAAGRATTSALPAELGAWRGREVTLHGPARSCTGRVTDLLVLRQGRPHFYQRQIWDGTEGDPRATDAQVAAGLWEMAGEGASLVVGLVGARCEGAVWAQPAGGPARVLHRAATLDPALRERAHEAFRTLPRYLRLQREYAEAGSGSGQWAWAEGAPTTSCWSDGSGTVQVVTVRASTGGCGSEFEGRLWAAFRVSGGGAASLSGEDAVPWLDALSVADVDGDGSYEIIGDGLFSVRHLLRGNPALREALRLAWPDHDCPC